MSGTPSIYHITGTQNIPYFITSDTPTICHIRGTQNIPYFITCMAHQPSITLWAYRTYHISSLVWHTNLPSHYGHTEHTIFHHISGTPIIHHIMGIQNIPYFICYEMCMTYGISCMETYMKYESKSHIHFLHFFSARSMGFGPV